METITVIHRTEQEKTISGLMDVIAILVERLGGDVTIRHADRMNAGTVRGYEYPDSLRLQIRKDAITSSASPVPTGMSKA